VKGGSAIENARVISRAFLVVAGCLLMSPIALAQTETPDPPPEASPPPNNYPPPPAGYPPPQAGYPPPQAGYPPPTSYAPPPKWVPVQPEPEHPRRVFSLTFSPFHLFLPVVELTGEARVHDNVGIALIGGLGRITDKRVNLSASVYETGGQIRIYVIGDFRHGMQLGGELLYLHLSDPNLSATGAGVAVGPFLGYKVMTDAGFTFDTQFGFEHVSVQANAQGDTAMDKTIIVLLNINIGWSF
jgi:hypothetical protein